MSRKERREQEKQTTDLEQLLNELNEVLLQRTQNSAEEANLDGAIPETPEGPKPYTDEAGAPLQVGKLRDGRPIYVAEATDGNPMRDARGEYVVIDPQTGMLREKLKRTHAQSVAPMRSEDQVVLAKQCLEERDPSYLAFVNAVIPPNGYKSKRVDPFRNRVVLFLVKFVTFLVKTLTAVRYFFRRPWFVVQKLPQVENYLSDAAKVLVENQHKAVIFEKDDKFYETLYLAVRVPMERDQSIKTVYVKKFANLLNKLAEDGVWEQGVLAGPSTVRLAQAGLRWEKSLFAFIYAEAGKYSPTQLNERYGVDVFQVEGGMSATTDWKHFPF